MITNDNDIYMSKIETELDLSIHLEMLYYDIGV